MPKPQTPLSSILPPLICGTGTFNTQYNPSIASIPSNAIISRALSHGIRAFDTSPYYGPSESLLGTALSQTPLPTTHPRSSYLLLTKAGRIAIGEFDYSPSWLRHSVRQSCTRLKTDYLDVVYAHDVEFVSPADVVGAITELRRLRDEEGTVRYIGISGYPVETLASLAELVLKETGEPLDAVQSYANYTLQNTRLVSHALGRLRGAQVDVVTNASLLGMGLLRREGIPVGGMGDWHPAPEGLRGVVREASGWVDGRGDKLEKLGIRWAVESWMREGGVVGGRGEPPGAEGSEGVEGNGSGGGGAGEERKGGENMDERKRLGVSVMGVSNVAELDETMRVWRSILHALQGDKVRVFRPAVADTTSSPDATTRAEPRTKEEKTEKVPAATDDGEFGASFADDPDQAWGVERKEEVLEMVAGVREILGEWYDYAWESPGEGFVNARGAGGQGVEGEGEGMKEKS